MHIIECELTPTRALLHRQHVERRTRIFVKRVTDKPMRLKVKTPHAPSKPIAPFIPLETPRRFSFHIFKPAIKYSDDIIFFIADFYRIDRLELRSGTRISAPQRWVAMYMVKQLTKQSYPVVGRIFNCHHTTVLASVNKVADRMMIDRRYIMHVNLLEARLEKALAMWRSPKETYYMLFQEEY